MEVRTASPKNGQSTPSASITVAVPESSDPTDSADFFLQTDIPERVLRSLKTRLAPEEGELQKEAAWIRESMQEILGQHPLPSVDSICRLLECYRVQHFDVPYIYAYRFDFYDEKELDRETTWEIFRLEKSWEEFQQRKKSLIEQTKETVEKLKRFNYMLDIAQGAANTFELDDVERFITFCQAIVAATSLTKESIGGPLPGLNERQQGVARARVFKLHEFAGRFSLTAEDFCDNLRSNKKEKQPPHTIVRAYTLAKDYICVPKLMDEHLVVVEISHYIAAEIAAAQPFLRKKVREYLLKYGELTTVPTTKGLTELDVFSPSYRVKRISHRPLETLLDDIWLDIQQREKDGLITVNIALDVHKQSELTNQLQNLFALTDDEISQINEKEQHYATEYNELLKDAFNFAIHDMVLPEVEQQVRQQLVSTAEQYVIKQCFNNFSHELLAPPLVSSASPSLGQSLDAETSVLVAVVGTAEDSRKKPVQVALLDETGLLCDEKVLLDLAYKNPETMSPQEQSMYQMDIEVLKNIARKKKPRVIVVAANCGEAASLYEAVSGETFLVDCYGHIESKMVKTRYLKPAFQDYVKIPASKEELDKNMSLLLRMAVSLGRQAQNPLAEILYNWELIKQAKGEIRLEHVLPLHPMQGLVSKKLLSLALKQAAINSVCEVGVDLNRCVLYDHLSAMIKYVSGLGKHLADYFITMLRHTEELKRRVDLLDRKILQPFVYRNCVAFIKVVPKVFVKDTCDVLDTTRLHPDFYVAARKLAVDALKAQGVDVPPLQDDNTTLINAAQTSAIEKQIASVPNDSLSVKGTVVAQIAKELKSPFKDPRDEEKPISDEDLAYALSGQTKQSIFEGQIVHATIIRQEGLSYSCRMDNGLEAVLDSRDEDVSGGMTTFKEREVVTSRIIEIKTQEGRLKVTLSAKSKDLKCHDKWIKLRSQDRTWFYIDPQDLETNISKPEPTAQSQKMDVASPTASKPPKYLPREIKHRRFANVSLGKAIEYLKGRDVGDFLFRPSSNGPEHLTLTLKFYKEVFVHIDIREESKAPGAPIGSKLILNEDSFATLDDIINNYVNPVMKRVREITAERKFVPNNSIDFLQSYIVVEHAKNPNVINYCFGIVPEYPQYVVLVVCPRQGKVITEYIKVKPQGYFFHDIYHKSTRELVEWFKQNFSSAEYQRYLRRRNRAPTLQIQPCEHKEPGDKLEMSPCEVMNTTYLPETEYQRPLEGMTDSNAAPSVYVENGQFSVYRPPETSYRNESNDKGGWGNDSEGIAGKRPFRENDWGNDNRGERGDRYDSDRRGGSSRSPSLGRGQDSGVFKEPYRMSFSRGRREGGRGRGFGGRGQRGRGESAWQVSTDSDPWNTGSKPAGGDTWGNDSRPSGGDAPWGSKPASDSWGEDSGPSKRPADSWSSAHQSMSGAEDRRDDYHNFNTIGSSSNSWEDRPRSRGRGDFRSRGGPRRGGGGRGCFNCGEEGHMSRDCPKKGENSRGGMVCYNCGKPGHISRDCTEERRGRGRGRGGRRGDRGGDRGGWRGESGERSGRGGFGGWSVSSSWDSPGKDQEKKGGSDAAGGWGESSNNDNPGGGKDNKDSAGGIWGDSTANVTQEKKSGIVDDWGTSAPNETAVEKKKDEDKKDEAEKVMNSGAAVTAEVHKEEIVSSNDKDVVKNVPTTAAEVVSGDKGADKEIEKENPKSVDDHKKDEDKQEHSGWT